MATPIFLIFCIVIFYRNSKLSKRIQHCESLIKEIQASSKGKPIYPPPPTEFLDEKPSSISSLAEKPLKSATKIQQNPVRKKILKKSLKMPRIIKENWIGVFGSMALVVGAVFFGLTAEIMKLPEVRVATMIFASFLFLGISLKFKKRAEWASLCSWLNSVAGAVILFATLGAGGIEGLRFIYSPFFALTFLSCGISMNILLAFTTRSQVVASLHVILSVLAICAAPQSVVLLPIGALIASIGLLAAYRTRWDLHILLIAISFSIQNIYWTTSLKAQLSPPMHLIAICCSLAVFLVGAFVHYRRKYQSTEFKALTLVSHITNWSLLIGNIYLHAKFSNVTPVIFGALAIVGYILARIAKKKGITWLYLTDTIFAQLVTVATIATMKSFSIHPMDLGLMVLVETMIFNFVCNVQKEDPLLRFGYFLQHLSFLASFLLITDAFLFQTDINEISFYLRMSTLTILGWSFHFAGMRKNFTVDNFRFVLFGDKTQKRQTSLSVLLGTLSFISVYLSAYDSSFIQLTILLVIGLSRKLKEDHSWNVGFICSLLLIHLFNWSQIFLSFSFLDPLNFEAGFLGIVVLDAILVFGNLLQFRIWKKNIHKLVIYALGIQTLLLTCVFMEKVSSLLPGFAFLGFSILALEVSRLSFKFFKFDEDVHLKVKEGMTHIGLAFLFCFIARFVTVHLQVTPIWGGISLRWATEILGLLTILYWIVFYPRSENSGKLTQFWAARLPEVGLGFVTLCVFVEMPEAWRPSIWGLLAMGLFVGSLRYKWDQRFYIYSWLYLLASIIHIAFVTYSLTMPSLFWLDLHNIPAFIAISLQLGYFYIFYKFPPRLSATQKKSFPIFLSKAISAVYRQPSLSVLLPVFAGIALLFAFNFEKAILTLLWVGLICIYLLLGLVVKSKRSIQIAMAALIFCSFRLIVFDLTQSDLATRAGVFIGVGVLMLGAGFLYKKYKRRIDVDEKI